MRQISVTDSPEGRHPARDLFGQALFPPRHPKLQLQTDSDLKHQWAVQSPRVPKLIWLHIGIKGGESFRIVDKRLRTGSGKGRYFIQLSCVATMT